MSLTLPALESVLCQNLEEVVSPEGSASKVAFQASEGDIDGSVILFVVFLHTPCI